MRPFVRAAFYAALITTVSACSEHKVATVEGWCEQISGVDLEQKYRPFWAVIFSVSFDGDSIRDDYANMLNSAYMKKVENRAPKMAWREGTTLNIVNLSGLMDIAPDVLIGEWRKGVPQSWTNTPKENQADPGGVCVFGTAATMFDTIKIHSWSTDSVGVNWKEAIITIDTERASHLGKNAL